MPKRALPRRWRLNKTMDQGFSPMTTERRLGPVFGPVRRNEAALSDVAEIAFNLSINLSGEASICRTDAFYTKLKSGPLWTVNN